MQSSGADPAEVVWRMLRRLVRERLERKPGGHLVEGRVDALDLRIVLSLAGPAAGAEPFRARLTGEIDRILDDAIQHAAAFRPGHAHCHRCDSVDCGHSAPPSCRHVFAGYTPTGLPRWVDFAQSCLDCKHPEVDRLFEEPPALVTLLQTARALDGEMVEAFRNARYELLGQLTAGFFPVRTRADEGRGIVALTVQVAASRASSGGRRLGLNVLGLAPTGEPLERLLDRQEDVPWRRAVLWAQSALQTLHPRSERRRGSAAAGEPSGWLEARVDGILRGLVRRLEHDHRARGRRTRHAEQRHASGERPTGKALDDARTAGRGMVLLDERRGTLVILGGRGRTHFFTPEGQLVSSVRYSRDAIERKIKLALWRPATSEQIETLRGRLQGREETITG